MSAKITGDMIIHDIITLDQGLIPVLMECGMHCVGCPSSRGESLAEACMVHGMNPEEVLARLNAYLENKEK